MVDIISEHAFGDPLDELHVGGTKLTVTLRSVTIGASWGILTPTQHHQPEVGPGALIGREFGS